MAESDPSDKAPAPAPPPPSEAKPGKDDPELGRSQLGTSGAPARPLSAQEAPSPLPDNAKGRGAEAGRADEKGTPLILKPSLDKTSDESRPSGDAAAGKAAVKDAKDAAPGARNAAAPARPAHGIDAPDDRDRRASAGAAPQTPSDTPAPPRPRPPDSPPPSAPEARHRTRGAGTLLLAGIVTALAGLGAGWALWYPGGPLAPDTGALEARVAALDEQMQAAEARLDAAAPASALAEAQQERAALAARLDTLEDAGAALPGELASLSDRLDELARRPPETDPEALAAYTQELKAIRAMVADELQRIRAEAQAALDSRTDAQERQQAAQVQAALAQIAAALDAGSPFAEPLQELATLRPDLDLAPLPAFAKGIPTLAELRESFPEAARAALAAQRQGGEDEGGLGGFLRGQLGLRSLAPREGADADAVLSRAEAALAQGAPEEALAELAALSPTARTALAPWLHEAELRRDALAAFAALNRAAQDPVARNPDEEP